MPLGNPFFIIFINHTKTHRTVSISYVPSHQFMKKYYILTLFSCLAIITNGQNHAAGVLLKENSKATGLSPQQLNNSIIADSYFNKFAGTDMIYLQQGHLGLPVYNQIKVLAFKNGRLVSAAGEFLNTDKVFNETDATPATSPEAAIQTALAAKGSFSQAAIQKTAVPGKGVKFDVGKLNVSLENITAELMWVPVAEGKLRLAWQVYFVPAKASDYWLIRVDAINNKVIDESNLTVYCSFDGPHELHENKCLPESKEVKLPLALTGSNQVQTANYLVIPFPAESPLHQNGTPALRTNPWTLAQGNATTLGWHNDGSTDYTTTRGNNVYAQEDRDNNNNTFGSTATSTTGPDPLNFSFTPDFTAAPTQTTPITNQQFNITNLFYWNNLIHDLTYLYGFDEVSGNFQQSNLARGGLGNDYVIADAQDAGGNNNANFATPPDGSRPRMQMYLWSGSPQRDGDVDNGVIVHEYGHGISNRLTGGPSNASCLQNGEQMGEGWSDYYGLMYTQDWSSATLTTGFTNARGIGTYASNQQPTGLGLRSQRYSTNFNVNNRVYAASIPTSAHSRGEIWCATLWDMTWNIINQVGSINPNIFDPTAPGGNSIALKLVTEGMKLQPCSPGFISGRNAILQADQILYSGLYSCAIKEAFRRRGMGAQASQGSSGSVIDQVPDFGDGGTLTLTQNGMTQVTEGQNITYTNTITSSCNALTGYTLRDTLPLNVTYVNGGSYNASNRVVSFPVTQAPGATQSLSFTVNVNNGSYFDAITLLDEKVLTQTIPALWSTTATPAANPWTVSSVFSVSAPNSFYVENLAIAGDQKLELVNSISLPAATSPKLSFSHRFDTEDGWDGGVVELSTNGGASWIDLGSRMVSGGYNGTLGAAPTNVLTNRSAFTGATTAFMQTAVSLKDFAGQNVKIRFRFGSDDNTSGTSTTPGWFIDNILLDIKPVVNMRAGLYNAANVRVAVADTVTVIIQGSSCTGITITSQPVNVTACAGNNASFGITASGTGASYQWQVSTDGGTTWNDIAGAVSENLVLNSVSNGMNGNRYRVVVSNICPSTIISTPATLTVSGAASFTAQPSSVSSCPGTTVSFTGTATGSSLTYQWQISTDGGTSFSNIAAATSNTYTTPALTAAMNGNKYRLMVFSCGPNGVISEIATVSVLSALSVSLQPANVTACSGNNASFTVTGAGTNVTYQWQVSADNGNSYINIPGQTSATLNVSNISFSQNGFVYRAVVSSTCGNLNSTGAILQVNTPVSIAQQPVNVTGCEGLAVNYSVTSAGTVNLYQWQVSANGGVFENVINSALYSGVNSPVLQITAITAAMNGNRYRAVVVGTSCGEVSSTPGLLTVYAKPVVTLQLQGSPNLLPGTRSTITAAVTPAGTYTYQWYRNGILLANLVTNSVEVDVDNTGEYKVVVTDANKCSVTSNLIQTGFAGSDYVFIYPNPNRGMFQVRMFNPINNTNARIIIIYDSKGAMVYRKSYPVIASYERMDVNISAMAAGVYMLDLRDASGKRLATGKVLVD